MGSATSTVGLLSDDELVRVKTSWVPVMENAESNGILMFKIFLERHNYYKYFKKFSNIPLHELAGNRGFQKHALSIMKTINSVITNIDNEAQVRTDLIDLGTFHRSKNVTEQQFRELKAVILEVFEKNFNLPVETLHAWNKAFELSYAYVIEGLTPKASHARKKHAKQPKSDAPPSAPK